MKKNTTRLMVSIFCSFLGLTLLAFIGCGGGGGGGSSSSEPTVTPPTQNIMGTYTLRGFTVTYSNGVTITHKDVASFSGTMKIGTNRITQSVVVNGIPDAYSGTYSITYTHGTSVGIFHITDSTGRKYDGSFSITNYTLSTYADYSTSFVEWDYWEKTSDSIESISESSEDQGAESKFRSIGEMLMEKNMINDDLKSSDRSDN